MNISDIKSQKNNPDRYSIYLDGKYSFSLTSNDLLESKVRKGQTLSDSQLAVLEKKSADSLVLARAIEKCMRRPHSEREIRTYLIQKKAADELIDSIIARCYKLNLLNDEYFAERWVEHRRNAHKSNRFIRNELFTKGVDAAIIDKVLSETDTDALQNAIAKKRSRYADDRKLMAYLQRQGFSYSDISQALMGEED